MKIIGRHKKTKEKVWFDTSWAWGGIYSYNLVCEYGKELIEEGGLAQRRDNRFAIDPQDYIWETENALGTNMPCHTNYGSDCCGIFNKIKDRTVVCNECGVNINDLLVEKEQTV